MVWWRTEGLRISGPFITLVLSSANEPRSTRQLTNQVKAFGEVTDLGQEEICRGYVIIDGIVGTRSPLF